MMLFIEIIIQNCRNRIDFSSRVKKWGSRQDKHISFYWVLEYFTTIKCHMKNIYLTCCIDHNWIHSLVWNGVLRYEYAWFVCMCVCWHFRKYNAWLHCTRDLFIMVYIFIRPQYIIGGIYLFSCPSVPAPQLLIFHREYLGWYIVVVYQS
jgi:hypothetical protein